MTVLNLFVPGWPKTKGSMVHIGGGQLRQSVEGSTRWAQLIKRMVTNHCDEHAIAQVPRSFGVSVHLTYWLPVDDVTEEHCGDIDKIERNVLDALKGPVYVDDVQVVRCVHEKWPHRPDRGVRPGVQIRVFLGYV